MSSKKDMSDDKSDLLYLKASIFKFLNCFNSIDQYIENAIPNKNVAKVKKLIDKINSIQSIENMFKPFLEKIEWHLLLSTADINLIANYDIDPVIFRLTSSDNNHSIIIEINTYLKKCIKLTEDIFYNYAGKIDARVNLGQEMIYHLISILITFIKEDTPKYKHFKRALNKLQLDGTFLFLDSKRRLNDDEPIRNFEDMIVYIAEDIKDDSNNIGMMIDKFNKTGILENIKNIDESILVNKNGEVEDITSLMEKVSGALLCNSVLEEHQESIKDLITTFTPLLKNTLGHLPSGLNITPSTDKSSPKGNFIQDL